VVEPCYVVCYRSSRTAVYVGVLSIKNTVHIAIHWIFTNLKLSRGLRFTSAYYKFAAVGKSCCPHFHSEYCRCALVPLSRLSCLPLLSAAHYGVHATYAGNQPPLLYTQGPLNPPKRKLPSHPRNFAPSSSSTTNPNGSSRPKLLTKPSIMRLSWGLRSALLCSQNGTGRARS